MILTAKQTAFGMSDHFDTSYDEKTRQKTEEAKGKRSKPLKNEDGICLHKTRVFVGFAYNTALMLYELWSKSVTSTVCLCILKTE